MYDHDRQLAGRGDTKLENKFAGESVAAAAAVTGAGGASANHHDDCRSGQDSSLRLAQECHW